MFGEIGVLSLLNKKYNQKDCFYKNIIVFENYNILQKYLTHTTNKILNFYTHTHTHVTYFLSLNLYCTT